MKDTGISIKKYITDIAHAVTAVKAPPYELKWAYYDSTLPNRNLNFYYTNTNQLIASVKGKIIHPARARKSVCIGSFKRGYTKGAGRSFVVGIKYKTVPILPSLHDACLGLTTEIVDKFYTNLKMMGLLSKSTTKRNFMKGFAVVDLDKDDKFVLYLTVCHLRCLRDEPIFVRQFVNLIDNGLDKYAAYLVASCFVLTDTHFPIKQEAAFLAPHKHARRIKIHTGYIAGLYRLKEGNIVEPVNKTGLSQNLNIQSGLSTRELGISNRGTNVVALLRYGNSISKSVKLAWLRKDANATDRLIIKAEAEAKRLLGDN